MVNFEGLVARNGISCEGISIGNGWYHNHELVDTRQTCTVLRHYQFGVAEDKTSTQYV
jgi:hypothetical protein